MPPVRSTKTCRSSRRRLATVAFVMLAAQAAPGWAAKVYRCGNVFQDLPCPDAKPAEQRPSERPPAPSAAAPCGPGKDANGRTDCLVGATPRDARTGVVAEAKR